MSSKLVKKLLQQTAAPPTNNGYDDSSQNQTQKRLHPATNNSKVKISKEEMVQEHIQSILRLDNLVQRHSSSTAQKSFNRHSSNIKQQQKQKQHLKRNAGSISNSRSSSSSFTQKPNEKSFDKAREKRTREEGYFKDLARALKKAKK
ncbi:hypothetical protein ACHAXR_000418, partial [Thalassiosira sp. AJA248-18]